MNIILYKEKYRTVIVIDRYNYYENFHIADVMYFASVSLVPFHKCHFVPFHNCYFEIQFCKSRVKT